MNGRTTEIVWRGSAGLGISGADSLTELNKLDCVFVSVSWITQKLCSGFPGNLVKGCSVGRERTN